MDLTQLNDKQKEAVMHIDGPLLILAGPGSGKTKVLTQRIAYLINEGYANPKEILAITFTNKAAKEMKERVHSLIGDISSNVQLSTFHSFGLRIIKENYKLLGLDSTFTILDEADTISLIKKIIKNMNLDEKMYNAKGIRYKISGNKNELITPLGSKIYANNDIEKKTVDIYFKYQEALKRTNSVDFDDLLMIPILLFKDNPNVLQRYQERYKYVFIDEYQDTNQAQYLLSKMISAKYKNICVVGDESQNIYSWRGANYKNILNFEKDYPGAHTILLEQNYRSTKTILSAANDVIKNNRDRKDKNLWTENDEGVKIKYIRSFDESDEAMNIINEIKKLNITGIELSNIAVLYRTNAQSQIIERKFIENNIPYKIVGSYAYYNRKEIKDLVAYLKLINNLKDDVSLLRCINTPKRGIGDKTIENIAKQASILNISMFEAIEGGKELEFKNIILDIVSKKDSLGLTELVEMILDKTGLRREYEKEKDEISESKLDNLEEFKSITRRFEENDVYSLEEFLMEISLISDVAEYSDDDNKVTLMTVHSAKGLEFKVVFISGLEEGLFPHNNSMIDTQGIEEERRLFYVAITRSKRHLYLLNAKSRMFFGNTSINLPSRFINEIDENNIEQEKKGFLSEKKIKKEEMYHSESVDIKDGDIVYHEVFKQGVVISVKGDIATIAFSSKIGIKTLLKNHKNLKKM